jgi:hypothetical protein
MNTIDPLIPVIKSANEKLYFAQDQYTDSDKEDPLGRVVPCFADKRLFFGGFVCNIVVFTKLFMKSNGSFDSQHNTTKALLLELFPKFARYELHMWIDSGATDILAASSANKNTFENKLITLAADLASCNVFYHGRKQSDQLKNEIDAALAAFKEKIKEVT